MKRKTTNEFIEQAHLVHCDRYIYDNVEYVTNTYPVTIICSKHGNFSQSPSNHLRGSGCPLCYRESRHTPKHDLIHRFVATHGTRYDYSEISNPTDSYKLPIRCYHHGVFYQSTHDHLRGSGCPKCKGVYNKTTEDFVEAATLLHGQYDYSQVQYVNNKTHIEIICNEHGSFIQTPTNHLKGQGCPKCGKIQASISITSNSDEWIDKVINRHGKKYDYSEVNYISATTKVTIICHRCGPFLQRPSDHLTGHGCPKCNHRISDASQEWLTQLGIPDDLYHREVGGLIKGKNYVVDGYDPNTKTVYEFNGDYWHGNPNIYESSEVNPSTNKTFGELYDQTLTKHTIFTNYGYNVISIWESDFKSTMKL